jgi:hypothetical protein
MGQRMGRGQGRGMGWGMGRGHGRGMGPRGVAGGKVRDPKCQTQSKTVTIRTQRSKTLRVLTGKDGKFELVDVTPKKKPDAKSTSSSPKKGSGAKGCGGDCQGCDKKCDDQKTKNVEVEVETVIVPATPIRKKG